MADYWGPEAVLLQDGRVLRAGAGEAGRLYTPATGTWTATGPRVCSLVGGSALTLLPNRQVLSVGGARLANCTPEGCGSEPVASAELYTRSTYRRRIPFACRVPEADMGKPEVPAPPASLFVVFKRDMAQSGRRLGT